MKKFSVIQIIIVLLLVLRAQGGTLTINGDLIVTTNFAAQSITLGGVTATNWAASLAGGYKYVVVPEGTNDTQRGNNLKTAYNTATGLSPSSSNRVAVIIPPGSYNLGTTGLTMNTSYVDLIGLVPSQITAKQDFTDTTGRTRTKTVENVRCPVLIYSSAASGSLTQSVDNIRIESVILTNTGSGAAYGASVNGANIELRHVSISSMSAGYYAGQYTDCAGDFGGIESFSAYASGTFIDCVARNGGFGGATADAPGTFIGCTGDFADGANASGMFIDCVAGDGGFGGTGTASGTFKGCVAGDGSFGSDGEASGTFIDCVAGDYSFGGNDLANFEYGDPGTSVADGTFIGCIGGGNSFGGGDGGSLDNAAKLQHCNGGAGSFGAYNLASDDFNYNVGGSNTFLMLPQLPTTTNGLPSGTVYNSSGTLKIMP